MDSLEKPEVAEFPSFRFTGKWRDYQARLLRDISGHLHDRKMNIVAAPGAGKTVLGLEVLRHLGRPTLILSPTLAIRDQWLHRLEQLFAPDGADWPDGRSRSMNTPGWITSTTYQALHMAMTGEADGADPDEDEDNPAEAVEKIPDLLDVLARAGIATIVLDEAHHLRRAWWISLTRVISHLEARTEDFHVLSLTATPPYDVEPAEWDRYAEICGPIDAEISIPELVKQGDLCPHQDFLHFSVVTNRDVGPLQQLAREARVLARRWATDPEMRVLAASHPWITTPEKCEFDILEEPGAFGGLLIVAKEAGIRVPPVAFDILGARRETLPEAEVKWMTPLFQALLDGKPGFEVPALRDRLRAELRAIGGVSRGKVRLRKDQELARGLMRSTAKINSIIDIAQSETDALGDRLRLVVLTDYIRADALLRPDAVSTDRMGAGPILRRLIGAGLSDRVNMAMVTGSLIVIPQAISEALGDEARKSAIPDSKIRLTPIAQMPGWARLDLAGSYKDSRLALVTRLFEAGTLHCLVGTAALLGEGWDAPSINSLVLASSVKSYMLSNQMRGRAIRRNPAEPDKIATIWHLATILRPDTVLADEEESFWSNFQNEPEKIPNGWLDLTPGRLGHDALTVFRRFKIFAGVSHTEPYVIQNGIGRLSIETGIWTRQAVRDVNAEMITKSRNRDAIRDAWWSAFDATTKMERPTTGVLTEPPERGKIFVWAGGAVPLIVAFLLIVLNVAIYGRYSIPLMLWLVSLSTVLFVVWHWRKIWRIIRAGSPTRYLREIGKCVIDGLHEAGSLETPRRALRARCDVVEQFLDTGKFSVTTDSGSRLCHLTGGTHLDETIFADAMAELLGHIENPRHVLMRRSGTRFWKKVDYHGVPARISADKDALEVFRKVWERRVGPCEIVSTRSRDGRRMLLYARAMSYASAFQRRPERLTRWQ